MNLVPLCSACHFAIHNEEEKRVSEILNKIYEVQKELKLENRFNNYLESNFDYIGIKKDEIINIYKKD